MAKTNNPFSARTPVEKWDAALEAKREQEHTDMVSRLVKNDDFRRWFSELVVAMNGTLDDLHEVTAFGQGIRSAAAYLERSLLEAPDGPALVAEVHKQYFEQVREGMLNAKRESKHA